MTTKPTWDPGLDLRLQERQCLKTEKLQILVDSGTLCLYKECTVAFCDNPWGDEIKIWRRLLCFYCYIPQAKNYLKIRIFKNIQAFVK